jgi:hypothetical protein
MLPGILAKTIPAEPVNKYPAMKKTRSIAVRI